VFLFRADPKYKGKGVARAVYNENDIFVHLASTYANNHKTMREGDCKQTGEFENGIINGAKWENKPGQTSSIDSSLKITLEIILSILCSGQGSLKAFLNCSSATLHDWSRVQNCFEIAVGLSCCKSVSPNTFAEEWENNKESIYKHIENAHLGIKGLVKKEGKPIPGDYVVVEGGSEGMINARGEYWILQLPGEYVVHSPYTYGNPIILLLAITCVHLYFYYRDRVNLTVEKSNPPKATVYNVDVPTDASVEVSDN